MSRLVCVAPNPAIDRQYVVDRLVPGAIHRPTVSVAVPGGKGLNAARAAHMLGADVVVVAILRGHAGRWIEEQLTQRGVRLRAVWAPGETRTCLSIRDAAADGLTEIYDRGEPVDASDWAALERCVSEELAAGAELLTVSGGVPPGVDDDAFGRLVTAAAAAGARSLVDAYGPGLAGALRAQPWLVKVNESEAAELLDRSIDDEEAAVAAAHELRRRGAAVAVITRGAAGAVAATAKGELRLGAPPAFGPYPVGSGDAFLGGLAAALLGREELERAIRSASAAAAANALLPGPGELDPNVARRLSAHD